MDSIHHNVYPRYFVCSDSYIERSGGESKIWLKFAMVNKKGGEIKFVSKEGKANFGTEKEKEDMANQFIEEGDWREILPRELVLMI